MGFDDEMKLREEAAGNIMKIGKQLRLTQITNATGIALMHRFYMYQSMEDYPIWTMIPCCVFLASKIEEQIQKMKNVLQCTWVNKYPKNVPFPKENSDEFNKIKDSLLTNERVLLQTIGFDLNISHPYELLLKVTKDFNGNRNLAQCAWNYVNDSYIKTTLCVCFTHEVISIAALCIAFKKEKIEVKDNWWQSYIPDCTVEELQTAIQKLHELNPDDLVGAAAVTGAHVATGVAASAAEPAAASGANVPTSITATSVSVIVKEEANVRETITVTEEVKREVIVSPSHPSQSNQSNGAPHHESAQPAQLQHQPPPPIPTFLENFL